MVDEAQLIAGVLAGERTAGRELYEHYAPRIYRLVYRLVGDEDLAQEFTQDTFIKAFARLAGFRRESSLGTWLHAIAVSSVLSGMRRVKRWRTREAALDEAMDVGVSPHSSQPDLKDRLREALDGLPDKLRVVVLLHDVEGYTHREIAAMVGAPEGTCKTRLAEGRARLRGSLGAFARE